MVVGTVQAFSAYKDGLSSMAKDQRSILLFLLSSYLEVDGSDDLAAFSPVRSTTVSDGDCR